MLPEEARDLLQFADNQEQLFELIAPENVPDFMGGGATKAYNEPPAGCKDMFELGRELYSLNEDEVRRLMEPILHVIKSDVNCNQVDDQKQTSFIEEFD